ncbi:MAG: ATP-binding protein [Dermatophilaceae bacterium]
MTRRNGGLSLPQVASSYPLDLPRTGQPPGHGSGRHADARLLRPGVGARGPRRRNGGWAPVPNPLVPYRASTAEVGAIFPFVGGDPLPPTGAALGVDTRTGSGFCVDPMAWVLAQITSNPNLMLFGKPGTGKSTIVKAILFRLMHFGVRTLVAGDVKDEYEPLCRAVGVHPFALGVGLPTRINPLDPGPLAGRWDTLTTQMQAERTQLIFARWLVLLRALVGAQGWTTSPADEDALRAVLAEVTGQASGSCALAPTTIPAVWAALRDPTAELAYACRYSSPRAMREHTRQLTAALGSMVHGALAGLFDAPTSIDIDWTAPIQSLSLSRLSALGDRAVGTALACLNSWSRAMTDLRRPGEHTIVVRDEVWRQMRLGAGAVQSLDADLRLSRWDSCIQMVVTHKPSDMLAAADTGTAAASLARDLLSLADTKVLLGQDRSIALQLQTLLGLSDIETDDIAGWARQRRGRAIWRVGERSYRIQTIRGPAEADLFDTNHAVRGDQP